MGGSWWLRDHILHLAASGLNIRGLEAINDGPRRVICSASKGQTIRVRSR